MERGAPAAVSARTMRRVRAEGQWLTVSPNFSMR